MFPTLVRSVVRSTRISRSYYTSFTSTQNEMIRTVDRFAEELNSSAMTHDREEKFHRTAFQQIADLGLLGITVDEQYGGLGLGVTEACLVHHRLSRVDPGLCLSYLAHTLLFTNNLNQNGSEEQKERFLPRACTGELIGGMGMSESAAGTDVLGMRTRIYQNRNNYNLTGSKMWITNGPIGDVFLVYGKSVVDGMNKLSMVIVERDTKGFTIEKPITNKCGMRASPTSGLTFDDVLIPEKDLVGSYGGGVRSMMRNLEIERICLAAMSLGIAERCLDIMVDYSKERKAFGQSIHNFGQIQQMIGRSYAEYNAAHAYLYSTAQQMSNSEENYRIQTDGVKLFCGTMAKNVADRAMQVLGGNGYVGDYAVERLWRDARLIEIGGGTNESHQKNITKDLVK